MKCESNEYDHKTFEPNKIYIMLKKIYRSA